MREYIDNSKAGRYLLTVAALVIVIAGLNKAASFMVPFLLSIFIAVICAPVLFWLKGKRVPTILAILLIVLWTALIGLVIFAIIGTSLNDFSRSLPAYQELIQGKTQLLIVWLNSKGINTIDKGLIKTLDPGAAMQLVRDLLIGLKNVLTKGFLIMLTVIFILLEATSFTTKLRAIFGDPEVALQSFDKFKHDVQRYIVIKTLTSLATGIAIAIWMSILGVDYPLLWGFLAFLLNYIPTIGSILAAVPAVLLTMIQLSPMHVLLVTAGYLAVNVTIGNFLEPRILGRGLGLSTLVVFLSLVFWGAVFGPVGMLLSVPLTMTAKIAFDSREETRWIAILLGSEVTLKEL